MPIGFLYSVNIRLNDTSRSMTASAHSLQQFPLRSDLSSSPQLFEHPWPTGYVFESPGAHLTYQVVGPCCRLYDREQLPWPCCRIQWRSKEPSWRRIGRRFTVDLSTRRHPSYCVKIIGQSYRSQPIIMTLYPVQLSAQQQAWWHIK